MASAMIITPSTPSGQYNEPGNVQSSTAASVKVETMAIDEVERPMSQFLIRNMLETLESIGFGLDAAQTVSTRISKNTVEEIHDIEEILEPAGKGVAQRVLSDGMFNRTKLSQNGLYLNSNEPVLLLDFPPPLKSGGRSMAKHKDQCLRLLREMDIRPVRVYVREVDMVMSNEFGLCLLNVVNTDIGGPSMIQLLDSAFHGEGWKEKLVLKEAWNGENLLWCDKVDSVSCESEIFGLTNEDDELDNQISAEQVDTVETDNADNDEYHPSSSLDAEAGVKALPVTSVNEIPEMKETQDSEPELIEHPAWKELREKDASRPAVMHPTWSREHERETLLDIITAHSGNVKDNDPISIISQSSNTKDDDFEVIDRD